MNRFPLKKFGKSYGNGFHPEGGVGKKNRFGNIAMRVNVTITKNKIGGIILNRDALVLSKYSAT